MKHFTKLSKDTLEDRLHEMYLDMRACDSHLNCLRSLLEKMTLSIKLLHMPNYGGELKEETSKKETCPQVKSIDEIDPFDT